MIRRSRGGGIGVQEVLRVLGDRPRYLCLRVIAGPETGAEIVASGSAVPLGRAPGTGLALGNDSMVSRHHATVMWDGRAWTIRDAGSKNGTFVEKGGVRQRVSDTATLEDGAIIHLGATALRVYFSAHPQVVTPAAVEEGMGAIQLRVQKQDDRLIYQLTTPKAFEVRYEMPWNGGDVEAICDELNQLFRRACVLGAAHGYGDELTGDLKSLSASLTHCLLPDRLRAKLRKAEEPRLLLVHDAVLAHLPWELVCIEDAPWTVRFDFGRHLILENFSAAFSPKAGGEMPRLLIVADPTEDLPEVRGAAEQLLEDVAASHRGWRTSYLCGERATLRHVMRQVQEADVMYYLGHGRLGRVAADTGWVLSDGIFTGDHVRGLVRAPTVVIANACESGREPQWENNAPSSAPHTGLASAFLMAGTEAYLGTQWPVNAGAASVFGGPVLEGLLRGQALGGVLRRLRGEALENAQKKCVWWASYVMYGDPALKLNLSI